MLDEATGESTEPRMDHQNGEAEAYYRSLQGPVRVGIEATGPIRWFECLLAEPGHELWIGDAAKFARAPKKAPPATARELESFTEVQAEALSSSVFRDRRAVADQRIRRRRTHATPSPPPKSPHSRRRHVDRHNARYRLEAPRHRNPAATPAVAGLAQKTNSLEFHEVARIRSVV